jgi:hypothetical protein
MSSVMPSSALVLPQSFVTFSSRIDDIAAV